MISTATLLVNLKIHWSIRFAITGIVGFIHTLCRARIGIKKKYDFAYVVIYISYKICYDIKIF